MSRTIWAPLAAALALGPVALLQAGTALAQDSTALTVTDKGCTVDTVTIPAGQTTFEITNASSRVLEWEILSGVMVVAERENILPGFKQSLTTTLEPGDYALTCGLLSNPKGKLVVQASGTAAGPGAVDPMQLVGPVAEYKIYVQTEADLFVLKTEAFTAAIKAGDVEGAKALYADARSHYERIEPIAELFSDLDASIDSRADDWEQREADPGFTGYHRLEYALFAKGDVRDMGPVADRLQADVVALQGRIKGLAIPPATLVGGAAALIEEVAGSKISGEEDRYSGADLSDFQANVDGAKKILELLRSLVEARNPDLVARSTANFATVDSLLAQYRNADGSYKTYSALTEADRDALKAPVAALAEDLAQLAGALGIQAS